MTDGTQPGLFDQKDEGESLTLGLYAEQAYLDYAVSVVRGRALPDVGDGQKPVQRRILYAMQAMGLPRTAAAKRVVVGDDPALEMRMAVSAGAYGVGMTTGLMKRSTVRGLAAAERPHALLESLEGLADKLR